MPPPEPKTKLASGLYLVATPIGNLEDITLRALRVLREVDLIACEDTRQTSKLLAHYDIAKRMVSYHEHNERERAAELVTLLEKGASVALVSDAGTPVISDPGHRLVTACIERGIAVVPVPGPSAAVAALGAAGLASNEFLFLGFLPARGGERRRALEGLRTEARTMVLYEAPHRLADTLADAAEVLGARPAVVARELTKLHEEFARGTLAELAARYREKPPRGEITLLIGPGVPGAATQGSPEMSLAARVEQLEGEKGLDRKAALKQAARERGLSKREAYKQLLKQ
jgi:16S rRNA (cytidine1402-2'-O)-methyltransferase